MNNPQGPNKTVPQDHPGPQAVRPQLCQPFPLDQDGQLLSWIWLLLLPSNCTTRPSPLWILSLTEKLTTWLFSWQACRTDATISIGPTWSPSILLISQQETYSPTMGKLLSATVLTAGTLMSPPRQEMLKTMTCSTISWWILWNPSSELYADSYSAHNVVVASAHTSKSSF